MTTHLYYSAGSLDHITPDGHPERPARYTAVMDALDSEVFAPLVRFETKAADTDLFALAHPDEQITMLAGQVPDEGRVRIDPDTVMSPKTWDCVHHAVGGGVASIDALFAKEAGTTFLVARPPGHHAEKTTAMGFCFINTAAVMARYAQREYGVERVAIVDWDVHHGNGTQDIFEDDPSVMYCSTHQMPLYPGTGAPSETGVGNIVNAPLSPGMDGDGFKEAFRDKVLPAVDGFYPDLIIISAGFDAHHRDPLANIMLEAEDFGWATGKLMDLAGKHCDNRVASLLEGGYDLVGLAESSAAHVQRLMRG
ncbi:MAG: histone deacetylase family protein [Pseudomonadota bacterium]